MEPSSGCNFLGKREFCFKTRGFAAMLIRDEHPLLLDYQMSWTELSFKGTPSDSEGLVIELSDLIHKLSQGWRALPRYLNNLIITIDLLQSGGGVLWRGPEIYGTAIASSLEGWGLRVGTRRLREPLSNVEIMLLDRSYVVAESFSSEAQGTLAQAE